MIPERTKNSIDGLRKMIDYLESKYPIKDMVIVEVGSWTGCSMVEFAKRFKEVVCIDPWAPTGEINTEYNMNEVEKLFDSRMKSNVTKIKDCFENVTKSDVLDIIYIDGLHNYKAVKRDILQAKEMGFKIICGHDYWPKKFPGVIKAVHETLGKPDRIFKDTSWIKGL